MVTANLSDAPPSQDPGPARRVTGSFIRIAPDGERFWPHLFADGLFRVADPALGRVKHHAANQISITFDEIADYLRRGFLLRMRGEHNKQVNLIAASEITAVTDSDVGEE